MWEGYRIGSNLESTDFDLVEADDFFKFGTISKFATIRFNDEPVGNIFITLVGKNIYMFALSGFYFDDPEFFAELILPKLELLGDFK